MVFVKLILGIIGALLPLADRLIPTREEKARAGLNDVHERFEKYRESIRSGGERDTETI